MTITILNILAFLSMGGAGYIGYRYGRIVQDAFHKAEHAAQDAIKKI